MGFEWNPRTRAHSSSFQYKKHIHKKRGFRTKAEGCAWKAKLLEELKNPPPKTLTISLVELETQYLSECESRFVHETFTYKLKCIRDFNAYLGNVDIPAESVEKITAAQFIRCVSIEKGNATANSRLKDLQAMYNWDIKNDLIATNPFKNIRDYPVDEYRPYVPPAQDIERVIIVAEGDNHDLLIILYYTGARLSEILKLTWDNVTFEQRWVNLHTRKRRGGALESNKIAMTNGLYKVLAHRWKTRNLKSPYVLCHEDGSRYTRGGKGKLMKRLCKEAGVKPFGFHAIRHHVASFLMESGKATPGQIRKFLCHKRKTTTEAYLQELDRDLGMVAEILENREKPSHEPSHLEKSNE
jgi:integrase